jgi:molecular chaperone GrpE
MSRRQIDELLSMSTPHPEPESSSLPPEAPAESATALEQQLAEVQAECETLRDRALRLQAELENFRKRTQREVEENRKFQALTLVRDLLPGLDNLHRTLQAAEKSQNVDELVQGVRLVLRQLEDALKAHGAVAIDAVGQPFDPNQHAALGQVPSAEHPPLTVLEELQRGYRLHDRVVRPSQVLVSSGPPEAAAPPQESNSESSPTGS